MHMLMVRSSGTLQNGEKRRVPIVRERLRKFGHITSEKCLSVKQDILITGPNACGKTRWLRKLVEHGGEVWHRERLLIRAIDPIIAWVGDERIKAEVETACGNWSKMQGHERIEAAIDWVTAKKVVLLIDDAHRLTGRKLDIAIRMARCASVLCVSATQEQSIPITLRMLIDSRDPQRIKLRSDAAYDMTPIVMWLMILAAISCGWYSLAAVIGGTRILAGGRRAAKQS